MRRPILPPAAALFALAWLVACTPLEPDPPPAAAADEAAFRQQLLDILVEEEIPGAALAYVRPDGTVLHVVHGVTQRPDGAPVTTRTMFRAGSVTKTFLGLAVVSAANAGKLALDEPLAPRIPGAFQNPYEAQEPLTLAHLLEHTDGFDDTRPNEFLAAGPSPSLADVLAVNPRSRVSRWKPGTRRVYGNPGYTVAAYALEIATGVPFDQHVEDTLLRRMGMARATLRPSVEIIASLPTGYAGRHNDIPVEYQRILHRPAGNLVTDVEDLAQLPRLFLGGGVVDGVEVVPPAVVEAVQRMGTLRGATLPLGYARGVQHWQWDGVHVVGHGGNVDGFSASWGFLPRARAGFVTLTNANNAFSATDRLQRTMVAFATRGTRDPPAVETARPDLSSLAGTYRPACPRTVMLAFADHLLGPRTFTVEDGALWEHAPFQHAHRLVHVGEDRFRREDESLPHLQFLSGGVVVSGSRCWEHQATPLFYAERGFVFGNIALQLSSLALAPWWWWRRRSVSRGARAARACAVVVGAALFGALSLVLTIRALYQFQPLVNPRTVGMFAFPLIVAVAGAAGVVIGWRVRREVPWALAVCVGAVLGCAYMQTWGILGFQAWSF